MNRRLRHELCTGVLIAQRHVSYVAALSALHAAHTKHPDDEFARESKAESLNHGRFLRRF
jgi:hypothetical protein